MIIAAIEGKRDKYGAKLVLHHCEDCGKPRYIRARYIKLGIQRICLSCHNRRRRLSPQGRGQGSPAWKGGRWVTPTGYIKIWLDRDDFFHPMCNTKSYVTEHRLVMAKHLGRCLLPWEIVHHKNGIKDDNCTGNLQLVTEYGHKQAEEMLKHIRKLELRIKYLEGK